MNVEAYRHIANYCAEINMYMLFLRYVHSNISKNKIFPVPLNIVLSSIANKHVNISQPAVFHKDWIGGYKHPRNCKMSSSQSKESTKHFLRCVCHVQKAIFVKIVTINFCYCERHTRHVSFVHSEINCLG